MSGIVETWQADPGAAQFFAILFGAFILFALAVVRNKR